MRRSEIAELIGPTGRSERKGRPVAAFFYATESARLIHPGSGSALTNIKISHSQTRQNYFFSSLDPGLRAPSEQSSVLSYRFVFFVITLSESMTAKNLHGTSSGSMHYNYM